MQSDLPHALITSVDSSSNLMNTSMMQQSSAMHQSGLQSQSVMELYSSLHQTINEMDYKVEHVIKKHQTQFLLAYQNHIHKIKKELAQIKHKSQEQEKMFSSNDRIQYLEREMVVFREEAIKLYAKIQYIKEDRDILMDKCKQMEKTLLIKQKEGKEYMRSAKIDQVKTGKLQERITELQTQLRDKQIEINKLRHQQDKGKVIIKNEDRISIKNEDRISIKNEDRISIKQDDILPTYYSNKMSPMKQSISLMRELPQSQSMRSSKYSPSISMNLKRIGPSPSLLTPSDFQLKDWFLSCIKVVKRQISHRNPSSISPFSWDTVHSIDDFTTIDKLRLLQMFVSNQKLLTWMYSRIFPERIEQVRSKLQGNRGNTDSQGNKDNQGNKGNNMGDNNNNNYRNIKSSLQNAYKQSMTSRYMLPHVRNSRQQMRNSMVIKNGKLNISIN